MAIIDKPSDYFNTVLYTGNGSSGHDITVPFSPDFTWIKERGGTGNHFLFDKVRGDNKYVNSNTADIEYTESGGMALGTNKFTLGNWGSVNNNSDTFASWNWKAGGSASSNTAGSINSSVSVNQEAGFSIVSYTGNGSAGATVAHGLNAVPYMMMLKKLNAEDSWYVYHNSLGNTKKLKLNGTDAAATSSNTWNNTSPTSSLFTLGNNSGINSSGKTMIAYCFAEKQGYSKFGSYTGNGNANGTFVYTGFKPAFVITKITSGVDNWILMDNKRLGYNAANYQLIPNSNLADQTPERADFLSNGFKARSTNGEVNGSGASYTYMAFAENPFVASNFNAATAR